MSEERNQESAPTDGAATNLASTSAPSVGKISAPLPPPRTMPFGPGIPAPTPPSRSSGIPSAAPPPPSRRGGTNPAPATIPRAVADDLELLEAAPVAEPSSPSQISATELDSSPSATGHSAPAQAVPSAALSSSSHSAPVNSALVNSSPSVPGTPSLDHVFSADDEPESQDGSVLSAGRVLSQPVTKAKTDPSTDFDDEEDEETRVLDTRDIGLSRRVDSSLKSALRSSVAPPPPPPGSRPVTQGPPSRLSNAPPMAVPSVRAPAAMPPPSGPPSSLVPPSRRPQVPPAAPAPGSHPLSSGYPQGFINPDGSFPLGSTVSHLPPVASATAPAPAKAKWPWVAAVAALVAAAGTWLFLGSNGDLLVSVSGPNNAAVSGVKIFVNGEQKCTQSPCQVTGLKPGPYTVRAEAPGFVASADQAVKVDSGSSAVANIQLKSDGAQAQLTVSAVGNGLRVLVDGKDRGTAPLELNGLTPGPHAIRVEGPGFEAVEHSVTLTEGGAPVSVGPLSPKLLKGSLRLELGTNAEGAQVLVNGKSIRSLPATLELDAAESHDVLVRKIGYSDFEKKVSFSAAEPKIDLTIELTEGSNDVGGGRHVARGPSDTPETPAAAPAEAAEEKKPDFLSAIKGDKAEENKGGGKAEAKPNDKPQAGGKGTLNINSVPPTTVLLDGRPLGKTPKVGVSVPAGSHSITFVHPEKGRKSVKVDVPGGGSKNVTIRL